MAPPVPRLATMGPVSQCSTGNGPPGLRGDPATLLKTTISRLTWVVVWLDCVEVVVRSKPSSPVFGSTSCCPVTQFPCPSIPLPSRVCSFSSTPPSQDIILLLTVTIHHPSRSIPVIKSPSIRTPVLLSWTSILSSQTVVPLSRTYFPFNTAQSLTSIVFHIL